MVFFFTEDFFLIKSLNYEELNLLKNQFHANHLVTYDNYVNELHESNFNIHSSEIMTIKWQSYTKKRLEVFKNNFNSFVILHGKEAAENLLEFYNLAHQLLIKNKIGGIRYICNKP